MTVVPAMVVRVWVPDVWDVVDLEVTPDQTFAQIKAAALERALGKGRGADPRSFLIKYRGALIAEENQTVGELQVPDHAPMIVLPAKRRPVT
jgi:hypothetical protein